MLAQIWFNLKKKMQVSDSLYTFPISAAAYTDAAYTETFICDARCFAETVFPKVPSIPWIGWRNKTLF